MKLTLSDLDFWWSQINLANNQPVFPNDPTGLRNVKGVGNNVFNTNWGNTDQIFPRLTSAVWRNAEGTFTLNGQNIVVSNTPTSYALRGVNLVDSQPRNISNWVANSSPAALSALGYTTTAAQKLAVKDDPSTTPNGRVSPLTGADNPLSASSFMGFFGQFFDHGLDFVKKGADGMVYVPLDKGDPLYAKAQAAFTVPGFLASRTNTAAVVFGAGGSDQVLRDLLGGVIAEGVTSFNAVTGASALGATAGGNIILAGKLITIPASNGQAAGDNAILAAINAYTTETGITASLDNNGRLVLTPQAGASFNTISPYIDLSQSYGSVASHTVFLREYDDNGKVTGNLVSGHTLLGSATTGGGSSGVSRWSDIKANALRIGITLHDYNVTGVPMVRLNANGSTYFDANGKAWLIATNKVTGAIVYVNDTDKAKLSAAGLELLTNAQSFLDDMANGVLSGLDSHGDASGSTGQLLNDHIIAGDGRANENIGLTSVHDIFHSEHLNNVVEIMSHFQVSSGVAGQAGAVYVRDANGNYLDVEGRSWSGESIFQAAKGTTEMEYQHIVFAEFARKLSPNINAFGGYDITINPAITSEFANSVYRFGHSMMTDLVEMKGAAGDDRSVALLNGFLNPQSYNDQTAADLVRGTTTAVGNMIDEWVNPTLRDNLVGLPLDLATLNLVRGRDTGTASLNQVRADLFNQTGLTSLQAYSDWDDFGVNLVHSESLVNFIAAYAKPVLDQYYGSVTANQSAVNAAYAAIDADSSLTTQQKTDQKAYALSQLTTRARAEFAMTDDNFMLGTSASAAGSIGLAAYNAMNSIDLWIGGLAEKKVAGGMLGSTFDFIFAYQMISLQNGDRFYYLNRLAGTDMLGQIDSQLFSDLVMRNTGAQHLYGDIFSTADSTVDMNNLTAAQSKNYSTQAKLNAVAIDATDALGNAVKLGTAGFVGGTFYGNAGNYLDARGVLNPNGPGVASEIIIGTNNSRGDKINALDGNDTVYGDDGNDTIEGGYGNDFLKGGNGDDVIDDINGDDFIWGDAGNDSINGGVGIDQMFGGDGNDTVIGGMGADALQGNDGDDVIYGDNAPLNGILDKTGDGDVILGGRGNDTIYGQGGADVIDGGGGDDVIIGGLGLDALTGGEGNDLFIMDVNEFGRGNVLDGGVGIDIVDYSLANGVTGTNVNTGLTIDLGIAAAPAVAGQTPVDTYLNIEGARGTRFGDLMQASLGGNILAPNPLYQNNSLGVPVLVNQYGVEVTPNALGTNGQNVFVKLIFEGGLGNDTITGSNGIDTASYEHAGQAGEGTAGRGVTVNLATATAQNTGNAGNDTLTSIENLRGSAFNDTLTGGAGSNEIEGGAGADSINGGAGNDTVSYEHRSSGLTVDLTTGANGDADILVSIENVKGSGFADILTLGAAGGIAWGLDGDDELNGSGLADVLDGGLGADYMTGNDGGDIYIVDNIGDVVIEDAFPAIAGDDLVRTTLAQYELAAFVENLTYVGSAGFAGTGNDRANIITGGDGADILDGATDIDTLIGGAGNDVFIVDLDDTGTAIIDNIVEGVNADAVFVAPVAGTDTPSAAQPLATGFTAATGGVDTVKLRYTQGLPGDNVSYTLNVANVENADASLIGSDITVQLTGSAGNNRLTGHDADLLAVGGADTISGGAGDDEIFGLSGNDTLNGDAGVDYLYGGAGDDILNGGAGFDNLIGGDGVDKFLFSSILAEIGNAAGASDVIYDFTSGVDQVDLSAMVTLIGAPLQYIQNGAFSRTIGELRLENSMLMGDTNGDGVSDFQIQLSGVGSLNVTGNDATTDIIGAISISVMMGTANGELLNGTANADRISGLAGNDTINGLGGNDILDGGAGTDAINGGAGSDIYLVGLATDHAAAEFADNGSSGDTDEVRFTATTASTLTLYAGDTGIERVVIGTSILPNAVTTGTIANNIDASRLTYGVTLVGNNGANGLLGGTGNDTLTGNLGVDTFTITAGTDTVTDLGVGGAEVLNVSAGATVNATIGAAWTAAGTTVNRGTANITTNGLAVNLSAVVSTTAGNLGYKVTNTGTGTTLQGSALADTLLGGTGSDTLIGFSGVDSMNGGDGSDVYILSSAAEHTAAEFKDSGTDAGAIDEVRFAATAASTLTLYAGDTGIERVIIGTGTVGAAVTTGTTALNVNASALVNGVTIIGNAGVNSLTGSTSSNDTLTGGGGADQFIVTGGIDTITDLGNGGADILNVQGGTANATVTVAWTASATTVNRGTANISTNGFAVNLAAVTATTAGNLGYSVTNIGAATTLTGSVLGDTLTGGAGNDFLVGGLGNDRLNGGEGADVYVINSTTERTAAEIVDGGTLGGTDEVRFASTTANQTLLLYAGESGIETVVIGTGTGATAVTTGTTALNVDARGYTANSLTITGNDGVNTIWGTDAANTIYGNGGNDTINGGAGNDTLYGGLGNDSLTGGTGADHFVFNTATNATNNLDRIVDFAVGTDYIDLAKSIFAGLGAVGGTLATTEFKNGTTNTASLATDRIIYNSTSGALFYDADGTGNTAGVQIATLTAGLTTLNNTSFNIV